MHITVAPRYVAPPWEFEKGSVRRLVGMEDHVLPEEGPLAEYLSAFPGRAVVWDYSYQLFAIYEADRVRDTLQLRERVFFWDTAPDPVTGEEMTDEQIAALAGRDPHVQRRFMPFDYEFVRRRIRQAYEFKHDGADAYTKRIHDRNAARAKSVLRDKRRNWAQGWGEVRRYLPAIEEAQRLGYAKPKKGDVTPQIGVGIDLRASSTTSAQPPKPLIIPAA